MRFDDKERASAAIMAQNDLYFFSRWMFYQHRGYKWQRARHHKIICDALMRVYRGECKRLIINIPPRYSKTELAVVNFTAWALGKNPDSEFIHCSYSATLAEENSGKIINTITHPAYRDIFGGVEMATSTKSSWKTTAGGVFHSAGAGGSITGFGAGKVRSEFGGCILIDDPHKADEARSDTMRKNVIEWFQNTLESRKNDPKNTPIICIMQRLHEEDLAGWLLAGGNGEDWESLILPAITDDGESLWPEKHSIDTLRKMEQAAPYVFAGQYLQRPAPPSGGLIKPDMIQTIDAVPWDAREFVRGWDLAATQDGGDYTAGVKLAKMSDGRFLICDVVRGRYGPHDRDAAIKNTAVRDGLLTRQSLPQDPAQAGKTQAMYLVQMLAGYRASTSPESGDKVTRVQPFASQINIGNVVMIKAEWNESLIDEMRTFPMGKHDDQIDAMSRAFMYMIENMKKDVTYGDLL